MFPASSLGCFLLELCIIPFFPRIVRIWLGEGVFSPNYGYTAMFAVSRALMILHNVNTPIGNGISYFKLQMFWMTAATAAYIPLAWLLVQATGNWIGAMLAYVIVLIPYESLVPVKIMRLLNEKIRLGGIRDENVLQKN